MKTFRYHSGRIGQEMRCLRCVQPKIGGEPGQHLACRMLQRLIEGTGVADGEDIFGRFAARPADPAAPRMCTVNRLRRSFRSRCRRSRHHLAMRGRRPDRKAPLVRTPETARSFRAQTAGSPYCRRKVHWSQSRSPGRALERRRDIRSSGGPEPTSSQRRLRLGDAPLRARGRASRSSVGAREGAPRRRDRRHGGRRARRSIRSHGSATSGRCGRQARRQVPRR